MRTMILTGATRSPSVIFVVGIGCVGRMIVRCVTRRTSQVENIAARMRMGNNNFTQAQVDAHNARVLAGRIKHEIETDRPPSRPQSKPALCHEPLGSSPGEVKNPNRCVVSVVSFRTRLLDLDNLCPKYFVDSLRYAKLIQDDSPAEIELRISQVKVKDKQAERTEIELECAGCFIVPEQI